MNPGQFQPGNHPVHDMSRAGKKGKAVSPWRKANMRTKGSVRLREQWKREKQRASIA